LFEFEKQACVNYPIKGCAFVGPKVWSTITDSLKSSATFLFKKQGRNTN